MPKKQTIPTEIQEEVQKLIDEFNRVNLKESTSLLSAFFSKKIKRGYSARFKGKFGTVHKASEIGQSTFTNYAANRRPGKTEKPGGRVKQELSSGKVVRQYF